MLSSIQFLRAFASWIVVGHHFVQIFFGLSPSGHLAKFFANYGALGVDLFFVISGFVIYISTVDRYIPPLVFIRNRLIRIVPAYWFFSILTASILYFFGEIIPFTRIEFWFLIKSLLFIPALNPSGVGYFPLLTPGWSINLEFVFYGIFATALAFNLRYRIALLIIGITSIYFVVPKFGWAPTFYGDGIVFEFLIGVLLGCLYRTGLINKISMTAAIAMALTAILIILLKKSGHHWVFVGIPSALIMCAVLSQEQFFKKIPLACLLGDWSYSVYLSHVIVISLFHKIFIDLEISLLIVATLTIISIMLVSMGSFYWIEKNASSRFKKMYKD